MRKTVSQEELKILASVTMLIDHIGAILVYAAYLNAWDMGNYALSNSLAQRPFSPENAATVAHVAQSVARSTSVYHFVTFLSTGLNADNCPQFLCGFNNWERFHS